MRVKKEADGRRSVQAEVEVAGTPEEVWRAIASGPGISSWFVPTTVDGRVGGTTVSSFGPGDSMDAVAQIIEWEPPRRFVAEAPEEPGTVATEWTVEARDGGTCTVRVVHSWFATSDEWDHQFEGHAQGWVSFFTILRLYLEHFRGQPSAAVALSAWSAGTTRKAWKRLAEPLGLFGAEVGAEVTSQEGAPPMAGVVEMVTPPRWPSALLRLSEPAPALAHFFAMSMGGQVLLPVRLYIYGADAAAQAAAIEGSWQEWLNGVFPPPAE